MLLRDKEKTRMGLNREEDGKAEYEYRQLTLSEKSHGTSGEVIVA